MRQRIAIIISSLVAATVLAFGLSAAGFGPLRTSAETIADGTATEPSRRVAAEPEVVYVRPAPPRETVVVRKRVSGAAVTTRTPSRAAVLGTREHDDDRYEHEREHGEDEHEDGEDEHEDEDD